MKIRKLCAVLLALAQIAFGAVLISRGSAMDKKEEERIQAVIDNGQQILFRLSSFYYYEDNEQPLDFNLDRADNSDWGYRYQRIVTDDNGRSVIGASCETPPDGPYLDTEQLYVYRLDAKSVRAAFVGQDPEDHWYFPALFGKGKYVIGGKSVYVYAVGYVYEGSLVFTGVMIDGVTY